MTQFKTKSKQKSREDIDENEDELNRTGDSLITIKGPGYHEKQPIKMRRVDLLRRQVKEKDIMLQMYRSLGRKKQCESSMELENS